MTRVPNDLLIKIFIHLIVDVEQEDVIKELGVFDEVLNMVYFKKKCYEDRIYRTWCKRKEFGKYINAKPVGFNVVSKIWTVSFSYVRNE